MSDQKKTPPLGMAKAKPRAQTQPGAAKIDDGELRDAEGFEARKARERSPIPGTVRSPFDPSDDITGNYEGEMLAEMRANARTLPERVALLEVKGDGYVQELVNLRMLIGDARLEAAAARTRSDLVLDKVTGIQADVGELKGQAEGHDAKLEAFGTLLTGMATDVKRAVEREHLTLTRQIDIDKAGAIAQVDVQRAEELADIDITKARELDTIKAKADRRKLVAKIVASILGGGLGLWKLIELIIQLRGGL